MKAYELKIKYHDGKSTNFQKIFKKFSGGTPYFQKSKKISNHNNMGIKRKLTSSKTKINKKNRKFQQKFKKFSGRTPLFSKITRTISM